MLIGYVMRILSFKNGNFYLDGVDNIGDYLEIESVKFLGTRRIKGNPCYSFRLKLVLTCNFKHSEFVSFYAFNSHVRDMLTGGVSSLIVIEGKISKGILDENTLDDS